MQPGFVAGILLVLASSLLQLSGWTLEVRTARESVRVCLRHADTAERVHCLDEWIDTAGAAIRRGLSRPHAPEPALPTAHADQRSWLSLLPRRL